MLRLRAELLIWPLTLVAAVLLLLAAFPPGEPPAANPGIQTLLLVTAAVVLGSVVVPLGSDFAFILLWSALGLTLGAALVCLLAVSLLPLVAYPLVIALIPLTPNRTGMPSRASARNLVLFFLGLGAAFVVAVIGSSAFPASG